MHSSSSFLLLPLLLLSPLADASVSLQWSVLYDEVDFRGQAQITTDMCAAGCKIYATILSTEANNRVVDNIIINSPNTQTKTSVAALSKLFMEGTREKAYLEIGNAPKVTIDNTNANRESAPLALWIVSANSPFFRTAEVFEPLNLNRNKAVAFAPITILSAYPFTITVKKGDDNAVVARAAGFDVIDSNGADNCFTAMNYDFGNAFDGFALGINGPLLTLSFDTGKYPRSQVELTASSGISFDLNPFPQQPTFVSSPGFVCGGAPHQVYRSSALNTGSTYTLNTPNNREMLFNFAIDVDTDAAHPVMIYDHKTTINTPLSGNFKDGTNALHMFALQTYRTTVSFNAEADNFFGMRVWAEEVDGTKTTPSGGEATTSSTSGRSIIGLILVVIAVLLA